MHGAGSFFCGWSLIGAGGKMEALQTRCPCVFVVMGSLVCVSMGLVCTEVS